MGRIIQYRLLQSENQTGLMRPVVYCGEKHCESLQQVAINEKLAALLIKIKPERRTMRLERCFQEVLGYARHKGAVARSLSLIHI